MKLTFALFTALLLAPPVAPHAADAPKQKPNIVLFLIDDLGWRDLGCQGSTFYQTPNIDRLAKEGVRFTDAYAACAVCSPTRAAVLTGKYPARLLLTDWLPSGRWNPRAKLREGRFVRGLPVEEVTLAEALREGGCPHSSAYRRQETNGPTSSSSPSMTCAPVSAAMATRW